MNADERAYNDSCHDIAEQTFIETCIEIEEVYGDKIRWLEKEITRLKNRIEVYELAEKAYIEVGERLEKENEQLRKALGLCSPFIPKGILPLTYNCSFCTNSYDTHTTDCEYVRLTLEDTANE